jgi:hypothetical protein
MLSPLGAVPDPERLAGTDRPAVRAAMVVNETVVVNELFR